MFSVNRSPALTFVSLLVFRFWIVLVMLVAGTLFSINVLRMFPKRKLSNAVVKSMKQISVNDFPFMKHRC